MRLNESFETVPQQHYCAFLSSNHLYALPLSLHTGRVCLALITSQRRIACELSALTKLMARNVTQALSLLSLRQMQDTDAVSLGEKQRAVLLCMARGMTDKAISGELGVCIDTIKYHKRNLFRLLDADCAVRAVVTALQRGLLSLDELASPAHYPFR